MMNDELGIEGEKVLIVLLVLIEKKKNLQDQRDLASAAKQENKASRRIKKKIYRKSNE